MDAVCATYKIGDATVHIHGKVDQDRLKNATIDFLKSVERSRKSKMKEETMQEEKGA